MSLFDELLPLGEPARAALAERGITTPTPVQQASAAPLLAGLDVVLHAPTGTGKTLAYVLPLLGAATAEGGRRVLVVAPGAELAMQSLRVAAECGGEALSSAPAIATTNRRRERDKLQRSTRWIVGTPERLADLFADGKLKGVGTLVLDELDPILASPASGFLPELIRRAEPRMQIVVASATLGARSEQFIRERMAADVVRVAPPPDAQPETIAHHAERIGGNQPKDIAIAKFIQEHRCRRVILFVGDPRRQHYLAHYLGEHRCAAVVLSRDGSKQQRQAALQAFRDGQVRVLITTDAVARGLDVPDVDWVLHDDVPTALPLYVHRAGRTGRAGRPGTSVVFAAPNEREALRHLEKALGRSLPPTPARQQAT